MAFKDRLLLLLNLLAAKRFVDQGTTHWDHKDTTKWITNYPSCGGSYQSPINLEDTNTIGSLQTPLQFVNYDETFIDDLLFQNNGHSAEIALPETASGSRPMISGGLLNDTYEAHAVHFHWGSLLKQGSEHAINGHRYAGEMHIVHKNTKYETGDEASENADGIAVLGIMLDIVDNPKKIYSGLNKVFKKLSQIRKFETNTTISQDLSLRDFLGNINTNKLYAYKGSLTTPPCSEAVTWHVLAEPLQISRVKIYNLFTLTTENGKFMVNNNRPVQALNNREIYSLA